VFIMEADGKLLVHPTLVGESLKEKAGPVYDEVAKGTAAGDYVRYQWGAPTNAPIPGEPKAASLWAAATTNKTRPRQGGGIR
jgi:hypothetical protein